MNWHFFTKEDAPFSYDEIIPIECIDENKAIQDFIDEFEYSDKIDLNKFVNHIFEEYSEELREELSELLSSNSLESIIANFYDYPNSGEFDWNKETDRYYDHFKRMIGFMRCDLILDSGQPLHNFSCIFDECLSLDISSSKLGINFWKFYSGNGEPAGAQLALDIVDDFMRNSKWHVGFYNIDGSIVMDIASWAKYNVLNIKNIAPIVWFGSHNKISKCWSISEQTSDSFLKEFWDNYFEGALPYICRANEGLGIYYSVWEYGLEYNEDLFYSIKESCPITISSPNENRIKELYNQVISIYNDNRSRNFPGIKRLN